METQFIGDDDEIPRRNRDRLWKHNLLAVMMKFQCGIETVCGITNKRQNVMKFQCGKETIMEMQCELHLWRNSKVEKRLLWKSGKIHRGGEIPMGTRQIFNSVEYSES